MTDKSLTRENLELKLQLLATQAQLLYYQDAAIQAQYQQLEKELNSLNQAEEEVSSD